MKRYPNVGANPDSLYDAGCNLDCTGLRVGPGRSDGMKEISRRAETAVNGHSSALLVHSPTGA